MKKDVIRLLFKGIVFFLPIFVVLGYVEFRLSQVPNSYNSKRKFLDNQKDQIRILVLGDSWPAFGVDPKFFCQKGFNLAFGGQSIWYDVALTKKYVDQLPSLECVVISVSYFSLGYQLAESVEYWREYFYYRFWGVQARNREFGGIEDLIKYSMLRSYDKERVFKAIWTNFKVNFNTCAENGWVDGSAYPVELGENLGKYRVQVHNNMIREVSIGKNIFYLEGLLEELRKRNIRAVFVTLPVHGTYSRFADKKIRQRTKELIGELSLRFNCSYNDYFEDGRFRTEDFLNNDHLNKRGAEKFTRILNEEVISKAVHGCQDSGTMPTFSAKD